MHIYAIHLTHFRRFSRLTVYPNADLNVLIGSNNSGKTSILRALDLSLNPSYHPYIEDLVGRFDFHNADLTKAIEIWVYLYLEGSDSSDLHVQFGDKVSRWMLSDKKSLKSKLQEKTDSEELPFIPAVKQPMEEEQVDSDDTGIIELLAVRFSAAWQEESGGFELSWKIVDEVGDEIPFTPAHRRAIGFTLIPTNRDPARMLGFTRRSLLGKSLENMEISGPLHDILEKIEELKVPLKQTASMKGVLASIKKTITDLRLFEGDSEVETTITFLRAEIGRLRGALELAFSTISKGEKAKADIDTDDITRPDDQQNSFSVPLSYQGDGIQNALLLATLSSKSATKTQSIEAIEEPERSLEPWRVRSLFANLASQNSSQLFITTHSPIAVGEIKGADSLLLLVPKLRSDGQPPHTTEFTAIAGRNLPDPVKKEFERLRDIYARCLFARLILVVEGSSEMGYLPVALAAAAKKRGGPDLISLGLEFFENDEARKNMHIRAKHLKALGRRAVVLLDYDAKTEKEEAETRKRLKDTASEADAVFVWCDDGILEGVCGCDLETILAEGTSLEKLNLALKTIYSDPGHEIDQGAWQSARSKQLQKDCPLVTKVPQEFPDLNSSIFTVLEEPVARLTLFTLMHGPQSIKTPRDMRRLAEALDDEVPLAVMHLYDRLRVLLEDGEKDSKDGYWNLHKGAFVEIDQSR